MANKALDFNVVIDNDCLTLWLTIVGLLADYCEAFGGLRCKGLSQQPTCDQLRI